MTALNLALLLSGCARAEAAQPRIADSLVQIGIVPKAHSVQLRVRGAFSAVDQKTGETRELADRQVYSVRARPGLLHLGPYLFVGQVRLLPKRPEDSIEVGPPGGGASPRRYRGSLLVRPNPDQTLTVVQETGIEDYLYGVLPNEMSPDWPEEALKAQAVVARTFTVANLGKYQRAGYDLSDDQRSQVYTGLDSHKPRATAAIQATEGEVLTHKGKLFKAFFHSCCGGRTSSLSDVWGGSEAAPKPGRGVRDRWCAASPHYEWSAYFASADILAALNQNGHTAIRLKGIALARLDESGRARAIKFYTDEGTVEVKANDFRNWIGNTEVKSTRIKRVIRRKRGYEFIGAGFGHGVGLCQWGAREMAQKGKTYRQILQHYFPGAEARRREL